MVLKVKCPTCHRDVEWSKDSPWRPFCSERCKLIDLGAWANGDYVIAGKPVEADDELDIGSDSLASGIMPDTAAATRTKGRQ